MGGDSEESGDEVSSEEIEEAVHEDEDDHEETPSPIEVLPPMPEEVRFLPPFPSNRRGHKKARPIFQIHEQHKRFLFGWGSQPEAEQVQGRQKRGQW